MSGFANSGGGVLLWGIKEGPPLRFSPIEQIQSFLKHLVELSPHATEPSVLGIQGDWIPSKDNPESGYAALLIPESSLPPHRVILKIQGVQHHYYFRTGSDFLIASHTQLEDMFGRRPKPNLVAQVRGSNFPYHTSPQSSLDAGWVVAFNVVNRGRGTAKQVYMEFPFLSGMAQNPLSEGEWQSRDDFRDAQTGRASFMFELKPTCVIHPGMSIRFNALWLRALAFSHGELMKLPCKIYCEGCAPVRIIIEGTLAGQI